MASSWQRIAWTRTRLYGERPSLTRRSHRSASSGGSFGQRSSSTSRSSVRLYGCGPALGGEPEDGLVLRTSESEADPARTSAGQSATHPQLDRA
jgi:hypothetical protein